jgi:hypothetical protein
MTGHYEAFRDERIKNMKNLEAKRFWTAQHSIFKQAEQNNTPIRHILPSNPHVIKFVKNPTPDEQLVAVMSEPKVLKYIKNADPYVQLRAIKIQPDLIKHVKNPSEEMWIWAIDSKPRMIMKNPKPTWFMVKLAQERNVFGLNTHKGLTDEMRTYLTLVE